jgi:hypothetical protein
MPRFANVSCSQCGQDFGPGDHGFSHCISHLTSRYRTVRDTETGMDLIVMADQLEPKEQIIVELLGALKALRAAVKTVPEMNHQRFDSLGIQVNKAIARAEGRQ